MINASFDNPLQPPPPEISMRERKDTLWQKLTLELSQITDGIRNGIDEGIIETVVGFNALGIDTRQSCEGHLNWGTGAPWVDVETINPKVDELDKKAREAWEVADNLDREHVSEEELRRVFGEAHKARREAKAEHLKMPQKVMTLLEEFYQRERGKFLMIEE